MNKYEREQFQNHLNQPFEVKGDDPVTLHLVEVSETKNSGGYDFFSILFRGPIDKKMKQATRVVEHPQLGDMDLFIVPVRPEGEYSEDFIHYQAVFSFKKD